MYKETPSGNGYTESVVASGLNQPIGLAVDGSGNVFISNITGFRQTEVLKETLTGGSYTQSTIVTGLPYPDEIAVDSSDNVYIVDGAPRLFKQGAAGTPSLNFGNTIEGGTSTDSPQTVTVLNNGNQALAFSSVSYPADFPEASGVSTDCNSSTLLAPGSTCTLSIDFSPLPSSLTGMSSLLSEQVSLIDNSLNQSGSEQTVELSGTDVTLQAATMISPAPGSLINTSTVLFSWTAGTKVTEYDLHVGTTGPGSSNIFWGLVTGQSQSVTGMPAVGGPLYVRLYSLIHGAWQFVDYTYTENLTAPATLISPTPGSTLTSSTVLFTWTAGSLVTQYDLHVGTTGPGSSNIFWGLVTGQSQTITAVPTIGGILYVRLYSLIHGAWQYNDYTFTQFTTVGATMISPAPGTTLASSTTVFTWTAGVNVTEYCFQVRTAGSYWWNIFDYCGPASNGQSQTVTGIPSTGGAINVALSSMIHGVFQSVIYNYTAPSFANMTSPAPLTSFTSPTVLFSWTAGLQAEQYSLAVGTTGAGSRDIFGGVVSGLSKSVTGIPTNGQLVYVRLSTLVNGVWNFNDYTYNNAATMISPTPGSTLAGSAVDFSWSSGTGVSFYYLQAGTTGPGSTDIYYQLVTSQSQSVTEIPTTGGTLYVCLISEMTNYTQQTNCYTYTEAIPTPAVMTSPTSGSTLTGATQTFSWTAGIGVTSYDLHVGTTGAGSSNIFAGTVAGQSQSVSGIPTSGGTLYVRLNSLIKGAWQYRDYTYTTQ